MSENNLLTTSDDDMNSSLKCLGGKCSFLLDLDYILE